MKNGTNFFKLDDFKFLPSFRIQSYDYRKLEKLIMDDDIDIWKEGSKDNLTITNSDYDYFFDNFLDLDKL